MSSSLFLSLIHQSISCLFFAYLYIIPAALPALHRQYSSRLSHSRSSPVSSPPSFFYRLPSLSLCLYDCPFVSLRCSFHSPRPVICPFLMFVPFFHSVRLCARIGQYPECLLQRLSAVRGTVGRERHCLTVGIDCLTTEKCEKWGSDYVNRYIHSVDHWVTMPIHTLCQYTLSIRFYHSLLIFSSSSISLTVLQIICPRGVCAIGQTDIQLVSLYCLMARSCRHLSYPLSPSFFRVHSIDLPFIRDIQVCVECTDGSIITSQFLLHGRRAITIDDILCGQWH